MSANKYANLPDIDTAPDVYETEDAFPSSQPNKGDSSDEETSAPTRSAPRNSRHENPTAGKEELDSSSLIGADEASRRFRKAEKRRDRPRLAYAYPPSPTSSDSHTDSPSNQTRTLPLSHRLKVLQAELTSLESELADPSNPQLHKERVESDVDPGELIRGLVDVRGRLDKIRKGKEGRAKLVNAVLASETGDSSPAKNASSKETTVDSVPASTIKPEVRSVVEMDRRVGQLETIVGSSSATLDETSPLPPPLLPLMTKLNTQMTLLTQPRHIDSVSRRLKLLLSDLDRASAAQHRNDAQQRSEHRRNSSNSNANAAAIPANTHVQDQILPLLTRLAPSLPHIPHILTRLRTLSALHTSASVFSDTLRELEEEQTAMREALKELEGAIASVEGSLETNKEVVKGNVGGLEERVSVLLGRLDEMGKGV